ncbi:MAG: YncE family protein [Phocaeicola sp.]
MKKMNVIWFTALSLALTVSVGCSSEADKLDDPEVPVLPEEPREYPFAFLVANQGNQSSRISTLTGVAADGTTQDSLFYRANGRELGSLLKSVVRVEDRGYAVLQGSLTVEVFDAYTFKSIATIALPENTKPMYACYLGNDLLAVSDYATTADDNRLVLINTATNKIERMVEGVGQAAQMLVHNNKLYLGGNSLRIFDLDNITATGMRFLKDGSYNYNAWAESKMVVDKNDCLWIYHDGSLTGGRRMVCIDTQTEEVVKEVMAPGLMLTNASKVEISAAGDCIYISGRINNVRGIIALDITADEMPSELLFSTADVMSSDRTVNAMEVTQEGDILLCDVKDSAVENGKVHKFTAEGQSVASYTTGMLPREISLYE